MAKKKTPQKKAAKPKPNGKSNLGYAEPKKKAAKVTKSPRPQSLPGMEDREISALEAMARDYADIRDSRMQLSVQEIQKKKDIMAEMKRLKKQHYKRDGVEITIITEKENIKVKVKAHEEEAPEPEDEDVEVEVEDEGDELESEGEPEEVVAGSLPF